MCNNNKYYNEILYAYDKNGPHYKFLLNIKACYKIYKKKGLHKKLYNTKTKKITKSKYVIIHDTGTLLGHILYEAQTNIFNAEFLTKVTNISTMVSHSYESNDLYNSNHPYINLCTEARDLLDEILSRRSKKILEHTNKKNINNKMFKYLYNTLNILKDNQEIWISVLAIIGSILIDINERKQNCKKVDTSIMPSIEERDKDYIDALKLIKIALRALLTEEYMIIKNYSKKKRCVKDIINCINRVLNQRYKLQNGKKILWYKF